MTVPEILCTLAVVTIAHHGDPHRGNGAVPPVRVLVTGSCGLSPARLAAEFHGRALRGQART